MIQLLNKEGRAVFMVGHLWHECGIVTPSRPPIEMYDGPETRWNDPWLQMARRVLLLLRKLIIWKLGEEQCQGCVAISMETKSFIQIMIWLSGTNSGIRLTCDKQKQTAGVLKHELQIKKKLQGYTWFSDVDILLTTFQLGYCKQWILGWSGLKAMWMLSGS